MRFCGAGTDAEDVGDRWGLALAKADGLFDGELIKGVHAVFYAGGFDAGVGFVDAGFYLGGMLAALVVYGVAGGSRRTA